MFKMSYVTHDRYLVSFMPNACCAIAFDDFNVLEILDFLDENVVNHLENATIKAGTVPGFNFYCHGTLTIVECGRERDVEELLMKSWEA